MMSNKIHRCLQPSAVPQSRRQLIQFKSGNNILKCFQSKALLAIAAVVMIGNVTVTAVAATVATRHSNLRERHGRRLVVGGVDADPERFPYYTRLDNDGEQDCGGSLISPDFVLTAAHCALPNESENLVAVIGGHDYNEGTGLVRPVLEVFPYFAYDDFNTVNDVALLKIDPIPDYLLGENGNTTLLDLTSVVVEEGTDVVVIGMGALEEEGEDAEVLQRADLKIVGDEECDLLFDGEIHRKSMICARNFEEGDACAGDSGGPLVILGKTPEEDIQVGIVSWGERCGEPEYPGVYAQISYLRPWIDSILCQNSAYAPEDCKVTVDAGLSPITFDKGEDSCRDFPGAFFVNWWYQFQRCDWLRKDTRPSLYCFPENDAWVQCPLTCHSCTYMEDDDVVDDDYDISSPNYYEQSSSPVVFIILIVVSAILCAVLCSIFAYVCTKMMRKK